MYTGRVLLDSPVFPHKPGPLCAGMERTGWRRGYREYQHMATEPPGKTVCSHLTDHVRCPYFELGLGNRSRAEQNSQQKKF